MNITFLRKVWYLLGPSKKKLPLLVAVFIFTSFLETFGIGLLGPFLLVASDPTAFQSRIEAIPFLYRFSAGIDLTNRPELIGYFSFAIAVIFVIKAVLLLLSKFYISRFVYGNRAHIIGLLNATYLDADYAYSLSKNSAGLTRSIIVETQQFCYGILMQMLLGISNLVILFLLVGLLSIVNLTLLLSLLFSFIPVFVTFYFLNNKLKAWGKDVALTQGHMIKVLNHGLGSFKETRILGCGDYFKEEMHHSAQQYSRSAALSDISLMLPRTMIETTVVILMVSFVAVSQVIFEERTEFLISSLSVFAVASIRLLPAASQLLQAFSSFQKSRHAVDSLYAELKEAVEKAAVGNSNYTAQDLSSAKTKELVYSTELADSRLHTPFKADQPTMRFKESIHISNVTYHYPESKISAVRSFSLSIKKGESIAFIGKSGSGKTTIVDILLGLLVPQEGDITVDSRSIYEDLRSWQNLVGYIPQSIFLSDETIKRNIAFGVPDHKIDAEKVQKAIESAQLSSVITQLPSGIETSVGERGVKLSGGQRQRIGIARALYHGREILVLDEATSALDEETEKQVSQSIQALTGDKTLITIAHRLSTVEQCDRIYLLEKGEIIKSGTFEEVVLNKDRTHKSL